jgi:hypothetical protein
MNQALPDFKMALFAVPGWHFTRHEQFFNNLDERFAPPHRLWGGVKYFFKRIVLCEMRSL